jgi:hypothetical protein
VTCPDHPDGCTLDLDPRAVELAETALNAAMTNDVRAAVDAIQAIGKETGEGGLGDAVLAWCDAYIERMPGARAAADRGAMISPAFMVEGSGVIGGPEGAPVEVRWAARLIVARALDDQATFMALLGAVPEDPRIRGDHIWGLVSTVAASLRMFTGTPS